MKRVDVDTDLHTRRRRRDRAMSPKPRTPKAASQPAVAGRAGTASPTSLRRKTPADPVSWDPRLRTGHSTLHLCKPCVGSHSPQKPNTEPLRSRWWSGQLSSLSDGLLTLRWQEARIKDTAQRSWQPGLDARLSHNQEDGSRSVGGSSGRQRRDCPHHWSHPHA